MLTSKLIIILLPIIFLQLGLMIYALLKLAKDGVQNLSPIAWLLIILFFNLMGPILYLTIGRNKNDTYDEFD